MKKLDFIKVKNICPLEVTISKIKILWLEYFQIVYLYPEYIKNFQNSIIRKMTQVFLNTKRFEQTLHQYIYMEKATAPTPALSPGKSHGLESLVGRSPWGC